MMDDAERLRLYFDYRVAKGCVDRWGPDWEQDPERRERIAVESAVIHEANFEAFFLMLAAVLEQCDKEGIPVGPGRGSVGGSACCFALKIHDVDPIRWGLLFERFMNPDRVELPDVDVDLSQRHRPRVLDIVRELFGHSGTKVLQVAAYSRLGGRSNIDAVAAALSQEDPNAQGTAENLKKCLPHGNITQGTKQERELAWWLENGLGDKNRFMDIAEQAGWLETMLVPTVNDEGTLVDVRRAVGGPLMKLDGLPTNLAKHAAGVVILDERDLPYMPQTGMRGTGGVLSTMTGYDMYALGALQYPKWDFLGLRTLDINTDADILSRRGDGSRQRLIQLWLDNIEDPRPYEVLRNADTAGIFQMETDGYRRTLRDFQPTCFEHIVHLNALYRPGCLDFVRESDGKNMVEIYIDRLHGRETATVPKNNPILAEILRETQGIILFQEQAMRIARDLAGFSLADADALRKAIGKKRLKEMDALQPQFMAGVVKSTGDIELGQIVWQNIAAAARYSWNKSHAVEYSVITWLNAWFKATEKPAFYCALTNSWSQDKDRQAEVISEARQLIEIAPPDINVAQADFGVSEDRLVFGLNGIKGMGEAYRDALLFHRSINGKFKDFEEFASRVGGSVPSNIKKALLACGSFNSLGDDRSYLLAVAETKVNAKGESKDLTVSDLIEKNLKRKKKLAVPPPWEVKLLSDSELAEGEMAAIGYYISTQPLAAVNKALSRLTRGEHFGGKITSMRTKDDKNGNEMAFFTILDPALNKTRVTIFSSKWGRYQSKVVVGNEVLIRGQMDGSSILADAVFFPDDLRHFKRVEVTHPGQPVQKLPFTGDMAQVERWEQSGALVRIY